jgi:hypothetical protein
MTIMQNMMHPIIAKGIMIPIKGAILGAGLAETLFFPGVSNTYISGTYMNVL